MSYILFPYPFPCMDPFPSSKLIGIIMHICQQSCLHHPASPEHPSAHKRQWEHIVYSLGKAAAAVSPPSRSPDTKADFPVCQLPSLFSLPFEYLFLPKTVAFSTHEGNLLLYRQHPKLSRNQRGNIFEAKIQFSNFTQISFCQPWLFRGILHVTIPQSHYKQN